ncbi:MAG: DRTGG domain-containing protein [Ignavibacteria bacterium]|nr:DRTGG domain-containing protein [Ignavibacteria bacterium]
MKLKEVVERLNLRVLCGNEHLDREVTGGYSGDLLSDVIANSKGGNVWITLQVHVNIVAVAVLKELAAIIIVQGRSVAEETLTKAREENVIILVSELPAFETAGKLNRLGVGVT